MSRTNPMFVAAAVLLFAARANGGLTYRAETVTEGVKVHSFSGIVKVESGQSRFEITRSDEKLFEAGSVVLSSAKDSFITVLNPAKKTYYVLDFARVASSVAETQKQLAPWMTIPKPVATVKNEGPGGIIEGYPTQRWLIDAVIEVKTHSPADKSEKRFTTTSEIWTTEKLPA